MEDFTKEELEEAVRTIASMIGRSEKAQEKFAQGTSQYTLQKNRIGALRIASALITTELAESSSTDCFTQEELEKATLPIASLISKSEKAQQKLAESTWQYAMLRDHLRALYIASPLLEKALEEGSP